ncbi:MAG: hypothetical protein AAB649_03240 [Patescibacteria group bacterium]
MNPPITIIKTARTLAAATANLYTPLMYLPIFWLPAVPSPIEIVQDGPGVPVQEGEVPGSGASTVYSICAKEILVDKIAKTAKIERSEAIFFNIFCIAGSS